MKKCPNIKKRLLFPKYACPFFQEQVPKMTFSPSVHRQIPKQRGARGAEFLEDAGGVWGRRSPPRMIYLYSCTVFSDSRVIRMVGPSVFPEKQVKSEWLVLQYFQIHKLYQSGWSFSISRYTSYIKMAGPSVFPDAQVIPKWLDFQYF